MLQRFVVYTKTQKNTFLKYAPQRCQMIRNIKNTKNINKKGFTLIEMIVVIAIVAIMAAVLIPSLITWINSGENRNRAIKAEALYYAAQGELTRLSAMHQLDDFNKNDAGVYQLDGSGDIMYSTDIDGNRTSNNPLIKPECTVADKLGETLNFGPKNVTDDVVFISMPSLKANPAGNASSAVRTLLENIVVDGQILNQAILIEYHARTGNVVSVFYSDQLTTPGSQFTYEYDGTTDIAADISPEGNDDPRPYSQQTAASRRQGYFGTGLDGMFIPPPIVLKIHDGYQRPLHTGSGETIENVLYAESYFCFNEYDKYPELEFSLEDNDDNNKKNIKDTVSGNEVVSKINLKTTTADSFTKALDSFDITNASGSQGVYSPGISEYDEVDINGVLLKPGTIYTHRVVWILDCVNGNMMDSAVSKSSILERYKGIDNQQVNVRVNNGVNGGIDLRTTEAAELYFLNTDGQNHDIASARHLYNIRKYSGRNSGDQQTFTQIDDIDFTGTEIIFPPIPEFNEKYTAKAQDGEIKLIKNLKIADQSSENVGLFGTIEKDGEINGLFLAFAKNETLPAFGNRTDTMYIQGKGESSDTTDPGAWVGSVAGTNRGKIQDVTVLSDTNTSIVGTIGNLDKSPRLGGIVGRNDGAKANINRAAYIAVAPKIDTDKIAPIAAAETNVNGLPGETIKNARYLAGVEAVRPKSDNLVNGYNIGGSSAFGKPYGTEKFRDKLEEWNEGSDTNWKTQYFLPGRQADEYKATYPYMYYKDKKSADEDSIPVNITGIPDNPKRKGLIWPVVLEEKTQNKLTYYEKYSDGTYGFYYFKEDGLPFDDLKNNDKLKEDKLIIKETGYGIISDVDLKVAIGDRTDTTGGEKTAAGAPTKVVNDDENTYEDGSGIKNNRPIIISEIIPVTEMLTSTGDKRYVVIISSSTTKTYTDTKTGDEYEFNYFSSIKDSVSDFTEAEINSGKGYKLDYETNVHPFASYPDYGYRYPACQAKAVSYSEDNGLTFKTLPQGYTYFIGGFAKAILSREFVLGKESVNSNYGKETKPFIIRTPQQLLNVNGLACYAYYCKQELDLDFNYGNLINFEKGIYNTDNTLRRCVIGDDDSSDTSFSAIVFKYDGTGKKISGLNIMNSNGNAALINRFQGTVNGVVLIDPKINSTTGIAGGIVATATKLAGNNRIEVKNCQLRGKVSITGQNYAGGIVGEVSGTWNQLDVSNSFLGSDENEKNAGEIRISANDKAGGIIGYIGYASVKLFRVSVFDDVLIKANGHAGGFVGYLQNDPNSSAQKLRIENALFCAQTKDNYDKEVACIKAANVGGDVGGQTNTNTEIMQSLIIAKLDNRSDNNLTENIMPIRGGHKKGNCYFLSSDDINKVDNALPDASKLKDNARDTLILTAMSIGPGTDWPEWRYVGNGYLYPNINGFPAPKMFSHYWNAALVYYEKYINAADKDKTDKDYSKIGISFKTNNGDLVNDTLPKSDEEVIILETGYAIYYGNTQNMTVTASNSSIPAETKPDAYYGRKDRYADYSEITMENIQMTAWGGGTLNIIASISNTPADKTIDGVTEHNTFSYVRFNPGQKDQNKAFEELIKSKESGFSAGSKFNDIGYETYVDRGAQTPVAYFYEISARLPGSTSSIPIGNYMYCNFAFSESQRNEGELDSKHRLKPDTDSLSVRTPAQFINVRTALDECAIVEEDSNGKKKYRPITIKQERNLDFAEVSMYGRIEENGEFIGSTGIRTDDYDETDPNKYYSFDADKTGDYAYMFRKGTNLVFRGIYDGNNYKMLNINIDDSTSRKALNSGGNTGGLFDVLSTPGEVKNVVVVNPRITGTTSGEDNYGTGGIVGKITVDELNNTAMNSGTCSIQNCSVVFSKYYENYPGYIRSSQKTGGIAGFVNTAKITASNTDRTRITDVMVVSDDESRSPIFPVAGTVITDTNYIGGGIVGDNTQNGLKITNALYIARAPHIKNDGTSISPICTSTNDSISMDIDSCYYLYNNGEHGLNSFNYEAVGMNAHNLNTLKFRNLKAGELNNRVATGNPWNNITGCDYPVLDSLIEGDRNNQVNLDWLFVPITSSKFTIAYYEQYAGGKYGFYYMDDKNEPQSDTLKDDQVIVSAGYCFVNSSKDAPVLEYKTGRDDVAYPNGNEITLYLPDGDEDEKITSNIAKVPCTNGKDVNYLPINYKADAIKDAVKVYDQELVPITILPRYSQMQDPSIPDELKELSCMPSNRYSSAVSKFGKAISINSSSIVSDLPTYRGCEKKENRGVTLHIRRPEHIEEGIYTALTPNGRNRTSTAGKEFKQDKDLNVVNYGQGVNFGSSSSNYNSFMGNYDGNGKTMQLGHSLFPKIENAVIKNVTVTNSEEILGVVDSTDINCNFSGGAIAAVAENSNIIECEVKNSKMNIKFGANIDSESQGGSAGVIAGQISGGMISGCTVDNVVMNIGTMETVITQGKTSNRDSVGGIAGHVSNGGKIEGCKINKFTTTGPSVIDPTRYKGDILYVGGIAGFLKDSRISECAVYDSVIYNYEDGFENNSNLIKGLRVGGVAAESAGENYIQDIIIVGGIDEHENEKDFIHTKKPDEMTQTDKDNAEKRYFGGIIGMVSGSESVSEFIEIANVIYLAKAPYSYTAEIGKIGQYPIVAQSRSNAKSETNVYFLKSASYNGDTPQYEKGDEWSGKGLDTLEFNALIIDNWAKWTRAGANMEGCPYPRLFRFDLPDKQPKTYERYLVYYEKYKDNSYGYYAIKDSGGIDVENTLKDNENVDKFGYMITSNEKIEEFERPNSKFKPIGPKTIGTVEGVELELKNTADGDTVDYINVLEDNINGSKFYNPNFAKAMVGNPNSENPEKEYILRSPQQVKNIENAIKDDKHSEYIFKFEKNIDLGEYTDNSRVIEGTFNGKFDGNGKTIFNLKRTLFDELSGGYIKNLTIENGEISHSSGNVAAIVSEMSGGIIDNIRIANVSISGTDQNIGGVAGIQTSGTISNITIENSTVGNGVSNYTGGIVGIQTGGGIDKIKINTSTIKGGMYVGGIAGSNSGLIQNCVVRSGSTRSDSTVIGNKYVGGISGENIVKISEGTIESRGEINSCAVENSKVDGGIGSNVGGIAGINDRGIVSNVYVLNAGDSCPVTGNTSSTTSTVAGIVGTATSDSKTSQAIYLAKAPEIEAEEIKYITPISGAVISGTPEFKNTYYLSGIKDDVDYNRSKLLNGESGVGKGLSTPEFEEIDGAIKVIDPDWAEKWKRVGNYSYPILSDERFSVEHSEPPKADPPQPVQQAMLAEIDQEILYSPVYFEEYEDSSFGYNYIDTQGTQIDTTDEAKQIVDAGYGIISGRELRIEVGGVLINDGEMRDPVQKGELYVVPLPDEVDDNTGMLLPIKYSEEPEGELSVLPNTNTSYLPYAANALGDDTEVFGTESNPYIIRTEEQMLSISKIEVKPDMQFILERDLDFESMKLNTSVVNGEFYGIFNGNNKVIKGLNIDSQEGDIGLFSVVNEKGIIENLMIKDSSIKGLKNVGAVAGKLYGTVKDCIVIDTTVIGREENDGIIAGFANEATVENVFVGSGADSAPVKGTNNVGGIIGNDQNNLSKVSSAIYAAVAPSIDGRISPIIGNDNYDGGGLYIDCLYLMDMGINDAGIGNMEAEGSNKEKLVLAIETNFKNWTDKLNEDWIKNTTASVPSAGQSIFSTLFSMLF